jgi:hypothetical protein
MNRANRLACGRKVKDLRRNLLIVGGSELLCCDAGQGLGTSVQQTITKKDLLGFAVAERR